MSLACPFCSNGPKNCKCPTDKNTTFTTFTASPSITDVSTSRGENIGSKFLKDEKGRVLCPGCSEPIKQEDVAMITNRGPWHRYCAMATNSIGGDALRESATSLKASKISKAKAKDKANSSSSYKYFDPSCGMKFNNECPCCKKPTWGQESLHTTYEGKKYLTNQINLFTGKSEVVGVMHGYNDPNNSQDLEIWCLQCYEKEFKPGRDFYDE